MKAAAPTVKPSGPINVGPVVPAVAHIWNKPKRINLNVNQFIRTLFNLFGVKEVNGLSPFAVDMEIPGYLIKLIQDLFRLPKRYLRDNPRNDDDTNQVDNGGDEEDVDATLSGDITPSFAEEIKSLDLDEENYHISIYSEYADGNHDSSAIYIDFYVIDGTRVFLELKGMLR